MAGKEILGGITRLHVQACRAEQPPQALENRGIVIDNEDGGHPAIQRFVHDVIGSVNEKIAPLSGLLAAQSFPPCADMID